MSIHLVSNINVKDFGAETVRAGDLNADGSPDLLFVQSEYGSREITCLTATTILGEVLWQNGKPSSENGIIYGDLPVQVYDWDNDGANEVLWIEQATYEESAVWDNRTGESKIIRSNEWGKHCKYYIRQNAVKYSGNAIMHILDGKTGKEKRSITLPAPADDCFLFADLTGRGRREDFVVKDRYWNMWGVSAEGKELWRWEGSVGHFPAYGDVDNDGRDEIFVGYALIDHDGRVMFERPSEGQHQDASYAVRLSNGEWRLLFGNGGLHCLDVKGNELWGHPLKEAQHVIAGHYRDDSEIQFAVIDRGQPVDDKKRAPATLYLFDINGKEIWRKTGPEGSSFAAIAKPHWSSAELNDILFYSAESNYTAIINGKGNVVDELPMRYAMNPPDKQYSYYYCMIVDLCGDLRDEVVMFGSCGCCIYANARPLMKPTQYNFTLYPGM